MDVKSVYKNWYEKNFPSSTMSMIQLGEHGHFTLVNNAQVVSPIFYLPSTYFSDYISTMRLELFGKSVIDVGTGTGIIGLGCRLLGASDVWLTEILEPALLIARINYENYVRKATDPRDGEVYFVHTDLLTGIEPIASEVDFIFFNHPCLKCEGVGKDSITQQLCGEKDLLSRFFLQAAQCVGTDTRIIMGTEIALTDPEAALHSPAKVCEQYGFKAMQETEFQAEKPFFIYEIMRTRP